MKKYYILLIILTTTVSGGYAQHYQFSQYYAAATYLNPAFTGANVCSRFSLSYRKQWTGIPGTFTSYQASLDHTLRKLKSGIGLQLFSDKAGPGALTTTQISLLYAYEAKLNKKVMGRGGFSIGTIQRKVDYSKLILGDQIARGNAATSTEAFSDNRANYFDIGAGVLVYSRYAWAGLSGAHLNTPDQSLLNGSSPLPREIKFHAGYKYVLEEAEVQGKKSKGNNSMIFTFNYKKQNKFNQLDAGFYYNKSMWVLGLWYRGIPLFKPTESYENHDAVVFVAGISLDKFRIGYSYDYTISKLYNAVTNGSHELTMAYQLCNSKKSKKKKANLISCPKF